MPQKFYITTPLYYVNASPHIGHSYTNIAADCLARYMRQVLGEENVWFLTGTDEHGQKIQKAAVELKLSPQEFADKMVGQFKNLWEKLDISYNDFIRTTQERHIKTVQRSLEILNDKDQIYSAEYEGWYCTPCETFWTKLQLKENKCPDCARPVEKISETNYFFKLSRYQKWLIEYIDSHPDFIRPASRAEEVSRFLELNILDDLCISRPKERLSWGIPLPFSSDHVTYVWFDALINYISAVGEFDKEGKYQSKWWPADMHLIGKDILRQHAIYWPIILHALGIELPKTVFAHGWWLIDETKMSKSRGNIISPIEMADKFGVDAYRYFLLRDVPFGLDGNFSEQAIIKRLNSDLANDLGNLVYRTLTMIEKYFNATIPKEIIKYSQLDNIRTDKINLSVLIINRFNNLDFGGALDKIWELINWANKLVEEKKPWILFKENKTSELEEFILVLIEIIKFAAHNLEPFMPQMAKAIKEQLGQDKIKKGNPLFPRIDVKK